MRHSSVGETTSAARSGATRSTARRSRPRSSKPEPERGKRRPGRSNISTTGLLLRPQAREQAGRGDRRHGQDLPRTGGRGREPSDVDRDGQVPPPARSERESGGRETRSALVGGPETGGAAAAPSARPVERSAGRVELLQLRVALQPPRPRGTADGMRFRLLVMLTDWGADQVSRETHCGSMSFCGVRDASYPDRRPMGYPFDRPLPRTRRSTTSSRTSRTWRSATSRSASGRGSRRPGSHGAHRRALVPGSTAPGQGPWRESQRMLLHASRIPDGFPMPRHQQPGRAAADMRRCHARPIQRARACPPPGTARPDLFPGSDEVGLPRRPSPVGPRLEK